MERCYAKTGPFWGSGPGRGLFFYLLGVLLFASAQICALEAKADNSQTVSCQVRLEFARDEAGGQMVRYRLFLQVKNDKPRPIAAVSVLWLDDQQAVIGNSDADCRAEGQPLEVSQTGQCSRTIQTISNRLIQSFGQSIWTEIVNSELKTFDRIKTCKVMGYRYGQAE